MKLPNLTLSGDTLFRTFGLYHLTRLKADKSIINRINRDSHLFQINSFFRGILDADGRADSKPAWFI